MAKFTDNSDKKFEWSITMSIGVMKDLRDHLEVNVLDIIGGNLLDRLKDDPILLGDVLYVCCASQAEARDVTDLDFGRSLHGDAIAHGLVAFLTAVADSLPKQKGLILKTMIAKSEEVDAKVAKAVMDQMNDPKFMEKMDEQMNLMLKRSGEIFSSAQEDAVSTLDPS